MSKYGNIKTYVDGIKFDSKKEARRFCELKLLQDNGIIEDLKLQPRFTLLDTFKKDGKTYRGISYIADFQYYDRELKKVIVEDVKSEMTKKLPVYRMKKKLLLSRYWNINFIET